MSAAPIDGNGLPAPEKVELESCSYGSCDKAARHDGEHRCRCGGKCDDPAKGCAWHSTGRPEPIDLDRLEVNARAAIIYGPGSQSSLQFAWSATPETVLALVEEVRSTRAAITRVKELACGMSMGADAEEQIFAAIEGREL